MAANKMQAARSKAHASWRRRGSQPRLAGAAATVAIDEPTLVATVGEALTRQDAVLTELRAKLPFAQAVQQAAGAFHAKVRAACLAAVAASDSAILRFVSASGRKHERLRLLQQLGALEPPWLSFTEKSADRALAELRACLEASREARGYKLGQRIVREVTEARATNRGSASGYRPPRELSMPGLLDHVISADDVARMRGGAALVIDPSPALMPPKAMAAAIADIRRVCDEFLLPSPSPCNRGAFTQNLAWACPPEADPLRLAPPTRELLARLAALPALVEAHGWPRRLAVPPVMQLGMYPGDSVAQYKPHLDRWPSENHNRRELTFLLYVNSAWDETNYGGALRLHPSAEGNGLPHALTRPVDVPPLAGRIVVFASSVQMHEVLPTTAPGVKRLALTLWVDFVDDE